MHRLCSQLPLSQEKQTCFIARRELIELLIPQHILSVTLPRVMRFRRVKEEVLEYVRNLRKEGCAMSHERIVTYKPLQGGTASHHNILKLAVVGQHLLCNEAGSARGWGYDNLPAAAFWLQGQGPGFSSVHPISDWQCRPNPVELSGMWPISSFVTLLLFLPS